jgi:hypothetical protein
MILKEKHMKIIGMLNSAVFLVFLTGVCCSQIIKVSSANELNGTKIQVKDKEKVKEQSESELELETWMFDSEYFSGLPEGFSPAEEPELNLEEWMTSVDYFELEEEQETELENWMVSTKYFDEFINLQNALEVVKEEPLEIHTWMFQSQYFKTLIELIEPQAEQELKIENWMTDPNIWNKNPLDI